MNTEEFINYENANLDIIKKAKMQMKSGKNITIQKPKEIVNVLYVEKHLVIHLINNSHIKYFVLSN